MRGAKAMTKRSVMTATGISHAIDVQKKIRGRYEARGTGQSPRDTACLSAWLPNHATYGRRYLSDFSHTSYALHTSTTLSPPPSSVCERLATPRHTYPCAAGHCRGYGRERGRADADLG